MSGQDRETEELGHLEAISTKSKQKSRESRSTESADRRKAILNSARRVLIEQGYADFTMRGIARHAQIHLKTLQHYFSSKRELVIETVNYTLDNYYYEEYLGILRDIDDNDSSNGSVAKIGGSQR